MQNNTHKNKIRFCQLVQKKPFIPVIIENVKQLLFSSSSFTYFFSISSSSKIFKVGPSGSKFPLFSISHILFFPPSISASPESSYLIKRPTILSILFYRFASTTNPPCLCTKDPKYFNLSISSITLILIALLF